MRKGSIQPEDKYVLRMPDGMRDRIKVAAEANNRSMNAEIVATLDEKYPASRESELDYVLSRFLHPMREATTSSARQKLLAQANGYLKKITNSRFELLETKDKVTIISNVGGSRFIFSEWSKPSAK